MTANSLYDKKLLEKDYHPDIVAYYFREWNNYHMSPHKHDRVEIMYVIGGRCSVTALNNPISMTKGDLILLDANVPHSLDVKENKHCRMLNVEFIFKPTDTAFPSLRKLTASVESISLLFSLKQPYIFLKDTGEIYFTLKNLIMELDEKNADTKFMAELLLCQILIRISRLIKETNPNQISPASIYVKKALRFIHSHYYRNITVGDIAFSVNIHEGYLHRIFKSHTGYTPLEYLTRLRIEKAKMFLTHTDIPIIEISNYVGINSRQYFSYLFKKYTGTTPSKYRKNIDKFSPYPFL